ncbi:hypothetical protein FG386_001209 [Cryptosporidium ryanae]|uniref:uncharacterized protein n=1 Tax=Cryptosporidium ryanae TaxID=515981 RepID=UPI003519E9A3|nr:hypothetical protein FG386_001209 [Cryptosporidium ryanae]
MHNKINAESSLEIIQKSWPALSDWICEELYCSGLRIPKSVRGNNLWGKGIFEASDDEYLNLHAAALDSEPVDPFNNKDFIITSSSRLASHVARFGIYQYVNKKKSNIKNQDSEDYDFDRQKKISMKDRSKNKEKDKKKEDLRLDNESGVDKKKHKHWWSKYFSRQKKKKINSNNLGENGNNAESFPLSNKQNSNFEYLIYGSGNKVSQGSERNEKGSYLDNNYNISSEIRNKREADHSPSSVKSEKRRLFNLREQTNTNELNNNYNGPNYNGNQVPNLYPNQFSGSYMQNWNGYGRTDTNTYVPLNIKTSVFAAYFAAEPIIVHFSKTIGRNRRVKYGQEIGVAEAFPRTLNNELSNIILSRCDGTISIIYQMKGMPIQATRMFLVITCNDGP